MTEINVGTIGFSRQGFCPNCKSSWDGGDIKHTLAQMDIHQFKPTKEIEELAAGYGWTPENLKRFSKVKVYELNLPLTKFVFLECPDCLHVYNEQTQEHYDNIHQARNSIYAVPTEDEGAE